MQILRLVLPSFVVLVIALALALSNHASLPFQPVHQAFVEPPRLPETALQDCSCESQQNQEQCMNELDRLQRQLISANTAGNASALRVTLLDQSLATCLAEQKAKQEFTCPPVVVCADPPLQQQQQQPCMAAEEPTSTALPSPLQQQQAAVLHMSLSVMYGLVGLFALVSWAMLHPPWYALQVAPLMVSLVLLSVKPSPQDESDVGAYIHRSLLQRAYSSIEEVDLSSLRYALHTHTYMDDPLTIALTLALLWTLLWAMHHRRSGWTIQVVAATAFCLSPWLGILIVVLSMPVARHVTISKAAAEIDRTQLDASPSFDSESPSSLSSSDFAEPLIHSPPSLQRALNSTATQHSTSDEDDSNDSTSTAKAMRSLRDLNKEFNDQQAGSAALHPSDAASNDTASNDSASNEDVDSQQDSVGSIQGSEHDSLEGDDRDAAAADDLNAALLAKIDALEKDLSQRTNELALAQLEVVKLQHQLGVGVIAPRESLDVSTNVSGTATPASVASSSMNRSSVISSPQRSMTSSSLQQRELMSP